MVRITTKEPLRNVPPNFAVAKSRAHRLRLPEYRQRARPRQPGHRQGELRSNERVQGSDRTRLVLNLRRPRWRRDEPSTAARW